MCPMTVSSLSVMDDGGGGGGGGGDGDGGAVSVLCAR